MRRQTFYDHPFRAAGLAGSLLFLVLGASGILAQKVFSEPTTTKYGATVLVPLLVGATCVARRPLRVLVGAAIILGPFATGMNVRQIGIVVTPIGVLLTAAAIVAVYDRKRPRGGLTPTSAVMVVVLALLMPALVLGTGQYHYALWLIGTFGAGWLGYTVGREGGGRRFVLSCIVLSAVLQSGIAMYEAINGVQVSLYGSDLAVAGSKFFGYGDDYFRPAGTLQDPISLGNVLAFACPIGLGLALTSKRMSDAWFWAVATGVIGFAILLTYSRLSWIGVAAGLLVAIAFMPPRARVVGVVGSVAALLAIVSIGLAVEGQTLRDRYKSIANPTATTNRTFQGDRERQQIWRSAYSVFREHPATGVGFGQLQPALGQDLAASPRGLHAHSVYLQILASAGIAGVLALALLLGHILIGLLGGLRTDRASSAMMLGALVAMLVPWLTDTSARYTQVTAILGFAFGAAISARWWPAPFPEGGPLVGSRRSRRPGPGGGPESRFRPRSTVASGSDPGR